jgi:amino acid adenylation domain-containing protein
MLVNNKHEEDANIPILIQYEDRIQDYPSPVCIPQLVTLQAAAKPGATALISGNQVLSYGELNRRSNQLAHYLQAVGVRQGMIVGLCIERSIDMVIGLLGILKSGGAYLPMDPSYPPARLAFMLEDSQAVVLVSHQKLAADLPIKNIHVVCLDADTPSLACLDTDNPDSLAKANDLAYVIYTSGSTGQPKGVMINHGSLLNLVYWHQRAFALTADDRATQIASPAFDAMGWELWPYLTLGGSIYLPSEDTRVDPLLLRDWLVACGITITFLPTPLAESIMALKWPANVTLRYLLTGGDTLYHYPPPSLPFTLVNNYGPTETTVVATSGCVSPTEQADGRPTVGRPIANTQVYILDECLQQLPTGTAGEIYIGGVSLAGGYLNRSDLTKEKFIPHPFSTEPGARLYKTGDLGRYLPDGQIAFLGRIDHQIKIRGYRIEPGEIESVLNRHPAVRASVVVDLEDTPGEKRLVAYLVLDSTVRISISSLLELLVTYLPDYMIPSAFVRLDELPVTPNGKVNRKALPVPDETNLIQNELVAFPATPTEEVVAGIIASLLEIELVKRDENFFMLGGHSLLGAQVIARVADTFGVDLPLRSLFIAPTVRLLSAEIERQLLTQVEEMSDEEIQSLLKREHSV